MCPHYRGRQPGWGPDETFRIAGMVNPAITVRAGVRVSMRVINADEDTAHGLVITAPQWGGLLDAGDDHLARLHRVSRPVSRQPGIRISNDPRFEEKLVDVVGLYLDPPARAVAPWWLA